MTTRGLGRVLKQFREDKGWTMQQLANRAGVTDAYIAMLETGKRKNPSLATLRHIAKALGVAVEDLLK